jgi:hypothetical protein
MIHKPAFESFRDRAHPAKRGSSFKKRTFVRGAATK